MQDLVDPHPFGSFAVAALWIWNALRFDVEHDSGEIRLMEYAVQGSQPLLTVEQVLHGPPAGGAPVGSIFARRCWTSSSVSQSKIEPDGYSR